MILLKKALVAFAIATLVVASVVFIASPWFVDPGPGWTDFGRLMWTVFFGGIAAFVLLFVALDLNRKEGDAEETKAAAADTPGESRVPEGHIQPPPSDLPGQPDEQF